MVVFCLLVDNVVIHISEPYPWELVAVLMALVSNSSMNWLATMGVLLLAMDVKTPIEFSYHDLLSVY